MRDWGLVVSLDTRHPTLFLSARRYWNLAGRKADSPGFQGRRAKVVDWRTGERIRIRADGWVDDGGSCLPGGNRGYTVTLTINIWVFGVFYPFQAKRCRSKANRKGPTPEPSTGLVQRPIALTLRTRDSVALAFLRLGRACSGQCYLFRYTWPMTRLDERKPLPCPALARGHDLATASFRWFPPGPIKE
jgi:hypothetical protein